MNCFGLVFEDGNIECECHHGFDGICGFQMDSNNIFMSISKEIFVFGSNLAGIHGAGSALEARIKFGALQGKGIGLQGSSYAIPTKDHNIKTLKLEIIELYIMEFINFARQHPYYQFKIVEIGCGLAGYKPKDIAPMFKLAPINCNLPNSFTQILSNEP